MLPTTIIPFLQFFLFGTIFIFSFTDSVSQHPIIFVISFDGFRYNYFDKNVSPNMQNLRNSGSYADYMRNVFITKTFTNHHSIATGVYPEVHGVLGNNVYDPRYGRNLVYGYELWHYNDEIIPIWTLNEKAGEGRHSGIMMWPGGGDQIYQNVSTTFNYTYNSSVPLTDRIDIALSWIMHPTTPANLVFMYCEEPDKTAHVFGPESPEVRDVIRKVDNATRYLMNKLEHHNLTQVVNLFLLSDHGFETVTISRILNITDFIPPEANYTLAEHSPTLHIYPAEGHEDVIYNSLKNASKELGHFSVYRKNEILDRWHYKKNRRAPPILVLADESYAFNDLYSLADDYVKKTNRSISENTTFGIHGYDNTEMNMHPFFIAYGPLIKKQYKIDPFDTVDLYSLFSFMLKLEAPHTDGVFDHVKSLLEGEPDPSLPYILSRAPRSRTALPVFVMAFMLHLFMEN